jgi:GNAT superfamily N-acetyltransferase
VAELLAGFCTRRENEADIDFLKQLYFSRRAHEFSQLGLPQAALHALLEQQFGAQQRHYRSVYSHGEFLIVMLAAGGEPVGRLCLSRDASEILVVDIAVLPAQRNKGLGSALLKAILVEADAKKCAVGLHVDPRSPALRLYQRLGFAAQHLNGADLYMRIEPNITAAPCT